MFWKIFTISCSISNWPSRATCSTMPMLAPAEKFSPWLPMTRPPKSRATRSMAAPAISRMPCPMLGGGIGDGAERDAAREVADRALQVEQSGQAGRGVRQFAQRLDFGQADLAFVFVLEVLEVQGENDGLAAGALHLLEEALAG